MNKTIPKNYLLLSILLGVFLGISNIVAEEATPQPVPVASPAPNPVSARKIDYGKRGTFYLAFSDPYPCSLGIGLTHFFSKYFGAGIGFGKAGIISYAASFKVRPYAGKISPILAFTSSLSSEGISLSPKGFHYFSTGLDWKWDNGMLLHFGVHWTITPTDGQTAMKPYIQFGFYY